MDHLDLEAPGLTAGNVEKIPALFPAAVTRAGFRSWHLYSAPPRRRSRLTH